MIGIIYLRTIGNTCSISYKYLWGSSSGSNYDSITNIFGSSLEYKRLSEEYYIIFRYITISPIKLVSDNCIYLLFYPED
jgi:hypothetical protein